MFRRSSYRRVAALRSTSKLRLMSKPEFKARILDELSANRALREHAAAALLMDGLPARPVPD